MKKFISILLTGIMSAALLAGCGSSASSLSNSASSDSVQNATTRASSEISETSETSSEATLTETSGISNETETEDGSNILVLYFSGSGHTKSVADMIAEDTGADEFEITPSEPYTDEDLDWTDDNSRVNKEHEDASLQDIKFDSYDVSDWDSYDTVFVGYPIWWQDASWVMKSYVSHLDFTGKTVIPFCTSSSSPIGDSGSNLAAIAGSGNWLEGQRFSGSASEDEVQSWVESLDL